MKNSLIVLVLAIIVIVAVGGYYVSRGSGSSTVSQSGGTCIGTNGQPCGATSTVNQTGTINTAPAINFTVSMMHSPAVGDYLVNGSGFTLYYFKLDTQNSGTSACNGGCAITWPAFYTNNLVLPAGFNLANFSTITRSDGTKQLAYDGWPLYTYAHDTAAGEMNGQGVGGVWYAFNMSVP